MSFQIAELFHSSCDRRRTCHATPARSDHTNIGTLCATLVAPGVVPCASMAPGSDLDSWCAHCDGRLKEVFGTGTAAVIQSVGTLVHDGGELVIGDGQTGPLAQRFYDAITRVQYGDDPDPHGWRTIV